jgi:hypothetical protein
MGVSDVQVRSYVDDGFLVVEGLLSGSDLDEIAADVVRFARGDYPLAEPPPAAAGRATRRRPGRCWPCTSRTG